MVRIISTATLAAALLMLLSVGSAELTESEAPNSAQVTPIPMVFRILCGSRKVGWGPDCDGRTQYCDLTGPIVKCGSCERICKPDQSTAQCQSSCKMYLEFTQETAWHLALDRKLESIDTKGETERKEMKDQLNIAIQSMRTRSERERKEMKSKLQDLTSYGIVLSVGGAVILVFMVAVLALLIYGAHTIKDTIRRLQSPLSQVTDGRKKDDGQVDGQVDTESGVHTGENTPDNISHSDTENPTEGGTETRAGNATEIRTEDETTPLTNAFGQPSDAPSGVQS